MIFGMTTYTFLHVLISLIGILSGLVVLCGLLTANRMDGWTGVFLAFTVATSATGFGFQFNGFTPAIATGILSSVILAVTIAARYLVHLARGWRAAYVIGAVASLYLNVFVLVVQLFLKVPGLHALAPQGSEPPFAIVQGIVLLSFVAAGILAVKRFKPVLA